MKKPQPKKTEDLSKEAVRLRIQAERER
jgi:hypothetical protein